MENTARKVLANEIIKEAQEIHGNLDLLRVFLLTNSADIIREYEFITKLEKYASDADKVIYKNALKTLINVSLKRIELTDILYNANDSSNAISTSEQEPNKEVVASTIMMLPSLDDILVRVKTILTNGTDVTESNKEAFELLKTTVGQGKVLNAEGKSETWDNEKINTFLTESTPDVKEIIIVGDTVKEGEKVGFETIYKHLHAMIEAGKLEPEIKESLKTLLLGKIISGKDIDSDYLVKDEAIFENYYTRMISNIILVGITSFQNKPIVVADKAAAVEKKIEDEIKPLLLNMEKDEKQSSFATVTKVLRDIYKSFGFKTSLPESLLKAKEIAAEVAPNLLKRNKEASKSNIPIQPIEKKVEAQTDNTNSAAIEIYDESHNIQESNKPLWAEVEKYSYLNELFTKSVELSKTGNWRDALSMITILISSGKIKETETSTEILKWDIDQIKLWYYNIVEPSIEGAEAKTIEIKAVIIEEKKPEVKEGPVPTIGSIDSKENLTRLLKDNTLWKDTYKFKSFLVKTDHHRGGTMSLEIVDATKEQEKDLLITESNMTEFFDGLRNKFVETRNAFPEVKQTIIDRLSPFYEISGSEVKRIAGNLTNEADVIRKANKAKDVKEVIIVDASEVKPSAEIIPPVVVIPAANVPVLETVIEVADKEVKEVVTIPPTLPAATEESVVSNENQNDNSKEATENTAGEPSINFSEVSYEGFEDILKARNKLDMNKAIFAKVSEYAKSEDGIKAVFEIVNVARKDNHYKKSCLHNYKGANPVDLLSTINNIVTQGTEAAKKQ